MFVDYRVESWCALCAVRVPKGEVEGPRCPKCGQILRTVSRDKKKRREYVEPL
jgi:Zn finger protein HypA/HybF involved in hydrogenase expression